MAINGGRNQLLNVHAAALGLYESLKNFAVPIQLALRLVWVEVDQLIWEDSEIPTAADIQLLY